MSKWLSRKLIVTIGSILTTVAVQLGMPEQVAAQITDALVWIVGVYLAGQSAVDVVNLKIRAGDA